MTDNPDLAEAIRLLRSLTLQWPSADRSVYWLANDEAAKMAELLAKYPERPKLDGCPWCGGDVEVSVAPPLFERTGMRRVCCQNCQIYGPWGTDEADAAAAWNRRASLPDLSCALALLKEYLNEGAIPHDEVIDLVAKYPAKPASGPVDGGKP